MRIALWSSGFVRAVGGAERVVRSLAESLNDRGDEVLIVSDGTLVAPPGAAEGLPTAIHLFAPSLQNPLLVPIRSRPSALLRYLIGALRVSWRFHRWQPEIIHLHVVTLDVFLLMLLSRWLGARLVLTFHGLELELAAASRLSAFKLRCALRAADTVTAVSSEICSRLREQWDADAVHVPNGVEFDSLWMVKRAATDSSTFVFCGNLRHVKRVDLLLAAWKMGIERGGLESRLLVIGDGQCRGELQQLAATLELGDRVSFLGARSHEEAMRILGQARGLVLSSESEACPLSVIEAAALGKPVVAPAVGGLPELVESERTGFLYEAGDVVSLSEAVQRLARDPQLAAAMGRRARKRLRRTHASGKLLPLYFRVYAGGDETAS